MRERVTAGDIMKKEGFIIGVNGPEQGRLFCSKEKSSFRILTYGTVNTESIEDSISISPTIKSQLTSLGYKEIEKHNEWSFVNTEFSYAFMIKLKEYISLCSNGKKHIII